MSLMPELDDRMPAEWQAAFDGDPCQLLRLPHEERGLALMELAVRLGQSGEPGADFLLQRLPGADAERARAILLGLTAVPTEVLARRKERFGKVLREHLQDERPLVVAEAIDGLRLLGFKEAMPDVAPLLQHASPYVAGSVLRFLSRHDPVQAHPLLLAALDSPEPLVRQNAIDELEELACVEALPRLRTLVADRDELVRQAAQTAVAHLEAARAART